MKIFEIAEFDAQMLVNNLQAPLSRVVYDEIGQITRCVNISGTSGAFLV